jgi:hypothetical protein
MSPAYPLLRKSQFGPYDPNDPNQTGGDPSMYAPNMGGGGMPQDQPSIFGPTKDTSQSSPMFTPPPTGSMPDLNAPPPQQQGDPLAGANNILQSKPSMFAPNQPDQAGRRKNLAGDELPTMPEPPPHIPIPQPGGFFDPTPAYRARVAAVMDENAHNQAVYAAQMKAYETMTSARSLGVAYGSNRTPQYDIGPDGKPHRVSIDPMTGKPTMSPDPAFVPQTEAAGMRDANKMPTPDQQYADAQAHPENYPPGIAAKIVNSYQEGRKYQFPPQRDPAPTSQLFYGPNNAPFAFDPRTKTAQPVTLPGGGEAPQLTKPGGSNVFTPQDAGAIADAIQAGKQPPTITGLYRNAAPVRAELARRGFDLSRAETDWRATQKRVATLNGQQQTRLQQAVQFTADSADKIDGLYNQWSQLARSQSGFRGINRAALEASKQLPGQAGAIAQTLETQINDLTSELGTVYMGGNTPTDQSLKLAAQNLSSNWNEQTFKSALDQIRKNLVLRKNSIQLSAQPVGTSQGNPYAPPIQNAPATAPAQGGTRPPLSAFEKR